MIFIFYNKTHQILGLQKKRKVSTSKAVLEQCTHPIAQLVMSWRKLSALQAKVIS